MTLFAFLRLVFTVYFGIATFVLAIVASAARTRREYEYALKTALIWPWLFGRLQ